MSELTALLDPVLAIARQAGAQILTHYQQEQAPEVETKSDNSPLTAADMDSHHIITSGLKALTPDYPVLSEESGEIDFSERQTWQRYWLVDPLDGTKEFINNSDEFAVLIALIEDHKPILGVVYAPALNLVYYACRGYGAFKQNNTDMPQRLKALTWQDDDEACRVAVSRRHDQDTVKKRLAKLPSYELTAMGSALKFCLVADGGAHLCIRGTPSTCEWDTAAGQCILEQAGGQIITFQGEPLRYNHGPELLNPPFLAICDPSHHWLQYFTGEENE